MENVPAEELEASEVDFVSAAKKFLNFFLDCIAFAVIVAMLIYRLNSNE